jgi:hypothetical protein
MLMRLIDDIFWAANCLVAAVFTAPVEVYVSFLSLLLSWVALQRNSPLFVIDRPYVR